MWKVAERRKAKVKLFNVKFFRLPERAKEKYKIKNKDIKRFAWRGKGSFVEKLTREAEMAEPKGEQSAV